MIVSSVRGDDTAAKAAEFKLPEGVTVGDDGKLVDNRAFYQTRLTGNSTISTLQPQYDAAQKAKADAKPKDEGYSLMSPFYWVGGVFSSIFTAIGDMVKSILSICGYGGEDKTDAADDATKADKPNETKKA